MWTPMDLWTPLQSMQKKIPKLMAAHSGSMIKINKQKKKGGRGCRRRRWGGERKMKRSSGTKKACKRHHTRDLLLWFGIDRGGMGSKRTYLQHHTRHTYYYRVSHGSEAQVPSCVGDPRPFARVWQRRSRRHLCWSLLLLRFAS